MDKQHIYSTYSHRQPEPAFGILALMLYLFLVFLMLSGCAATRGPASGMEGPDAITRPTNCMSEERPYSGAVFVLPVLPRADQEQSVSLLAGVVKLENIFLE